MSTRMEIKRVWAMPNKWTFTIKPMKEILRKYVGDGNGWVDPFAGKYSPAEFRNDLSPEMNAEYNMEAMDFCTMLDGKYNGVLFDPPYSGQQIKESYKGVGLRHDFYNIPTTMFHARVKDAIYRKIKMNGLAISFGWNSVGFGKKRGFEKLEILLVCHGSSRNDTIVTVEQKRWHQGVL